MAMLNNQRVIKSFIITNRIPHGKSCTSPRWTASHAPPHGAGFMPSMLGPRGCVLWRTSFWTMGGSPFHLTLSGIWHLTSVVSWGTMFDLFESPWAPWPMVTMAHLKALSPRSKYGTWGMGKQPPIDTTKPPLKKRPTWIWFEHLLHRWVKFKLHRCWHYICSTISPNIWSNVWSNLHKLTARPQHTNSNRPPQKPPQKHKLKAQQKPSTPLEKTSPP